MVKINKNTRLESGLYLTGQVNLDSLTSGESKQAYRRRLWGTASDRLPDALDEPILKQVLPEEQRIQNWQIAYNLQQLSEDVIEPLIAEYGSKLKVFRGYQHPGTQLRSYSPESKEIGNSGFETYNKHFTGEAVDVFLENFRSNMFHHVDEMYELLEGKVCEVGLIYGGVSWVHLGINGKYGPDAGVCSKPNLFTLDIYNRNRVTGFQPIRGVAI